MLCLKATVAKDTVLPQIGALLPPGLGQDIGLRFVFESANTAGTNLVRPPISEEPFDMYHRIE